jgi:hypothetical protein
MVALTKIKLPFDVVGSDSVKTLLTKMQAWDSTVLVNIYTQTDKFTGQIRFVSGDMLVLVNPTGSLSLADSKEKYRFDFINLSSICSLSIETFVLPTNTEE